MLPNQRPGQRICLQSASALVTVKVRLPVTASDAPGGASALRFAPGIGQGSAGVGSHAAAVCATFVTKRAWHSVRACATRRRHGQGDFGSHHLSRADRPDLHATATATAAAITRAKSARSSGCRTAHMFTLRNSHRLSPASGMGPAARHDLGRSYGWFGYRDRRWPAFSRRACRRFLTTCAG